jgi:hypothetical protein
MGNKRKEERCANKLSPEVMLRLYNYGLGIEKIAKIVGGYSEAIRRCLMTADAMRIPHRAIIAPEVVLRFYNYGLSCTDVGKALGISNNPVMKCLNTHHIILRKVGKEIAHGKYNGMWKGNSIGYYGAHKRVIAARGRPSLCEKCGMTDISKRYHWANITGNYTDTNDYIRLCPPCHHAMDKPYLKKPNTILVTFGNDTKTVSEWAKVFGIDKGAMRRRFNNCGWSITNVINVYGKGINADR